MVHLGEYRDETDHPSNHLVAIKEFGKMRLRHDQRVSRNRRVRGPQRSSEQIKEDEQDPLYLVRTEVAIMKKLRHPNVIRLYEVLDDPDGEKLYMVFEYCANGPIFKIRPNEQVTPLAESKARAYFVQILSGIDYLHTNGIVHRDIKPDNILLKGDGESCSIVDFGVSEMFTKPGDDTMHKQAGSPAFMSPALCAAEHGATHGCPDDVWAFGVTLYCLVMGRLPFYKDNLVDLYESIQHSPLVVDDSVSPSCRDLLFRMMDKSEETRITVAELYRHAWVSPPGTTPIPTLEEVEKTTVEEITEEEVHCAICRIKSVFTVARAISKFKRRSTYRRDSEALSDTGPSAGPLRTGSLMLPRTRNAEGRARMQSMSVEPALSDTRNEPRILYGRNALQDSPLLFGQDITASPTMDIDPLSDMPEAETIESQVGPSIVASPQHTTWARTTAPSTDASATHPPATTTSTSGPEQSATDDEVVLCSSPPSV